MRDLGEEGRGPVHEIGDRGESGAEERADDHVFFVVALGGGGEVREG